MRLIVIWLGIANLRWAAWQVEQGLYHERQSDACRARACARVTLANRLLDRAGGWPRRTA